MNPKSEHLIEMIRVAFAILQEDDEDAVSVETGIGNVSRVEQLVIDLVDEGDADLDYTPWLQVRIACINLRNALREHGTDPDGEATQALYNNLNTALEP